MIALRPIVAEFVGTAMLLAIVVGSGMMGDRLSGGNAAVALLGNTVATGAGLCVLILIFGPVSGAHFNPVVTAIAIVRHDLSCADALVRVAAQMLGAIFGVWLAHAMFAEPLLELSTHPRDGAGQMLAEAVATFGLIGTILATSRNRPDFTPVAVGLYITAAYWFTASTAFANPAITIARSLSDSFAGIAPHSVPSFIAAQIVGAAAGLVFFDWLLREEAAR